MGAWTMRRCSARLITPSPCWPKSASETTSTTSSNYLYQTASGTVRDEPDQDLLGKRLASEAALSSVLEKALLLQRTLLTGKKEPNVAANELAVKAVDQENGSLEQEINNLKTELELRRTLAGNSAMAIVQRHGTRAGGSRGIFEGDTTRDRLKEVQKPRNP